MTTHGCAAAARVWTRGAACPDRPSGLAAATATTINAVSSTATPAAATRPARVERDSRDICLPFLPRRGRTVDLWGGATGNFRKRLPRRQGPCQAGGSGNREISCDLG